MNRPMIGVIPLVDLQRDSDWMLPGYLNGLLEAGGLPVMLPLTGDPSVLAQLAGRMDGFLFTGGQDVSPALYGEAPLPLCGECCPERDRMEEILLELAWKADKPLLGICRGIQLLNAALGGSLYQDLPAQLPSDVTHCQAAPYDVPVHTVCLEPDTPLHALLGKPEIEVNSYHHQGIKRLAPALRAMAHAPDGLVEAVYAPAKKYIWAVQWHPEFSYRRDRQSRKIFESFVRAMQKEG